MVMVAPLAVEELSGNPGYSDTVGLWLGRLRWPVILVLAITGIESTYRYAPCGRINMGLVSPGTILAALGWMVSTLGFGFYVNNFSSYESIYGGLGAVIVLLTWIWISGLMFLVGAEINMMWKDWRGGGIRHPKRTESPGPDV